MNDISTHAYQGNPTTFKVLISNEDITDDVDIIDEISNELDYPELNKWSPGECQITLIDPKGKYSPSNANNFFVKKTKPQSGVGEEVVVKWGFLVDGSEQLINAFKGKITKVSQNADTGLTTIIANDAMLDLFTKEVTNFGIPRQFRLELQENQGVRGIYPVVDFALPISDKSVEVKKSSTENFNQVDKVSTSGVYKDDNYEVGNDAIISEYVEFPDTGAGFPQLVAKSAYRDVNVKKVVESILDHISIENKEIEFPEIERPLNISRNPRIGYDVIGNPTKGEQANQLASWKGYPTDRLVEGDIEYVLYNSPISSDITTKPDSLLLKRNKTTGETDVLYRRKTEMWKLAKSGDRIAILCTDSEYVETEPSDYYTPDQTKKPRAGSYDSAETGGVFSSYIQLYNESDKTSFTLVSKTAEVKPQVGVYYIFGASNYQKIGDGYQIQKVNDIVPDTVRNFEIHNNNLFYFYAKPNDQKHHGVARVPINRGTPTALFQIESDGISHLGGNFLIEENQLFYLGTNRDADSSKIFVVSLNI